MAVNIQASYKPKSSSLLSQQSSFRRKRGRIETKKIHRKVKLKIRHILIAFLLCLGFFYGFSRLYLFLITWEKLNIDRVEIICQKVEIQRDIQYYFSQKYLGNILLLDIASLQARLSVHQWIEKVHIRKVFPSTIRIEATERIPIALLEKGGYFLIDKDGTILQEVSPEERPDLPVLIDAGRFRKDFDRKLALAWTCLEDLGKPAREQISVMDLTEYENVSVQLRNSDTWLIFGDSRFHEKFQSFLKNTGLFDTFGPLEYIDFRYEDRLVLRPLSKETTHRSVDRNKEAF